MAKVSVRRVVRVGGAEREVRGNFALDEVLRVMAKGAREKMRVMAEEARDMLLDRLYGAAPQPPGTAVVSRPPRSSLGGVLRVDRALFDHPPLQRLTVKRKAREGKDGRPLISTGDYTYGIEVAEGETEHGVFFSVRPQVRVHAGKIPIPLSAIAKLHEFGSAALSVPARPHWRPVIRAVKQRFKTLGKEIGAEALRLALRMMA